MSDEYLEYRFKRLESFAWISLALIAFLGSAIMIHVGEGFIAALTVIVLFLIGALTLGFCYAISFDGLCRRLFKRLLGRPNHPPLEDWSDQLEEKGMFVGEKA